MPSMRLHTILLLLPITLTSACSPATPSADPAAVGAAATPRQAAPAPAPVPGASAKPAIAQSFRQDMPYAELRKRFLAENWLPLREPACWHNIGGDAEVCNALPEVDSCSADGYCSMRFANRELGMQARIVTYGPYDSWNSDKGSTALKVRSLDVQAAPSAAAPSCPSQDFQQFLQRFASDKAVQRQFTAPFVKVLELRSDGEGDSTQQVYVAGAEYRDFDLEHDGSGFHFVDAQGHVDPAPLRVQISQPDAHARLVRYAFNMSEGNAFRFEERNGCWYLVEDPQAPAP